MRCHSVPPDELEGWEYLLVCRKRSEYGKALGGDTRHTLLSASRQEPLVDRDPIVVHGEFKAVYDLDFAAILRPK